MAVPDSYSQWVSAKLKTLLFMTMVKISVIMDVGKLCGSLSLLSMIKFLIDSTARRVSMLVYIEVTSAEKSRALLGIVSSFSSLITVEESLM
jgi:hypothetical protein